MFENHVIAKNILINRSLNMLINRIVETNRYMLVLRFLLLATIACAISNDPETEIKTVKGLVGRVLGEVIFFVYVFLWVQKFIEKFTFEIVEKKNPHRDYWTILPTEMEDHLTIKGTTGVAISNGLYMYIKGIPF